MLHILQDGELLRARDHREPNHFWADKEVVEDYLPKIGANAFAVYMLLSYYARSTTGRCYPSIATMSKKLKLGEPTIRKALNVLAKEKLITISKTRTVSKNGKPMNAPYTYTILDIKQRNSEGVVKADAQGGINQHPGVVKNNTPNNIYINNTKEQDSSSQSKIAVEPSESVNTQSEVESKEEPHPIPAHPSPPKSSIDQCLKDAVAEHIEKIDPKLSGSLTGTLAQKAAGVWRKKLGKPKLTADEYAAIARSIPKFVEAYKAAHPDWDLPTTPAKFESYYTQLLPVMEGKQPRPNEPDMVDHPEIPGAKMTRSQYNQWKQYNDRQKAREADGKP